MARLETGKRDALITFQRRAGVKNATYGTKAYTWADLTTDAQEWAEVQDILPSRAESVADGINIQRRPARVRINYRDDINSDMRIVLEDGRIMQIVGGPAELGRKQGLEMVCEEYSTEGERP